MCVQFLEYFIDTLLIVLNCSSLKVRFANKQSVTNRLWNMSVAVFISGLFNK